MHLVLLPGMDGTGDLFRPLVEALDPSLSSSIVRYPRHEPLSYDQLTQVAAAALPADRQYCLVAESFSGPIALRLAALRPVGLRALVLAASFASSPAPPWVGMAVHPWLFSMAPKSPQVGLLLGWRAPARLRQELLAALRSVAPAVLAARLKDILHVDATRELAGCAYPLLYIRPRSDRLVGRTSVEEIVALLPTVEVVEVEAPHLVLQHVPDVCARLIRNFVHEPPGV